MANLLGDVWFDAGGTPAWSAALTDPEVRLHLYGKAEPRRARKMGHLTVAAPTVAAAVQRAREARQNLSQPTETPPPVNPA
jgi:5-(carboxyamino)imidazole ribonucleotide synthase